MKRVLLVFVVMAMMAPGVAFATNSSCQAYSGKTCGPTSNTTSTGEPTTASSAPTSSASSGTTSAGSLPFTGLDLVALLAGGSVLLGAGFVVRRLSRDPK